MLSKTKVKYIQSLGQKKFRQSEGMFLAEGPKLVTELLQEVPQLVQEVFATADWMAAPVRAAAPPIAQGRSGPAPDGARYP